MKNWPFSTEVVVFPTHNNDSAAHCPALKKVSFPIFFCRAYTMAICNAAIFSANESVYMAAVYVVIFISRLLYIAILCLETGYSF